MMDYRHLHLLVSLVVSLSLSLSLQLVDGWLLSSIPIQNVGKVADSTTDADIAQMTISDRNDNSDVSSDDDNDNNDNSDNDIDIDIEMMSAWEVLAGNIGYCLMKSDLKRDSGFDGSSTGWTSWVEDSSAFQLQKCFDKILFASTNVNSGQGVSTTPKTISSNNKQDQEQDQQQERDDLIRWLKWIKSSPSPMVVELSESLRTAVNATVTSKILEWVEQTSDEFLSRIACRILLLPSGGTLQTNLRTAPGAMVYGKILYGGVTRYRLIGSGTRKRKAGERTVIAPPPPSTTGTIEPVESWLQYGGPERNYQAVDIGPCAVLEITILPKGLTLPLLREEDDNNNNNNVDDNNDHSSEMSIYNVRCNPNMLFQFPSSDKLASKNISDTTTEGNNDNNNNNINDNLIIDGENMTSLDIVSTIETSLLSELGGLRNEINSIVRRILSGRVLSTSTSSSSTSITSSSQQHDSVGDEEGISTTTGTYGASDVTTTTTTSMMESLLELGLTPVKGLLLYGPPGCGKTALARQISRLLTDRPPKIVSAPELLDRWVGGSEKLVRGLFGDAEAELKACNGDITKSGLHVIVIDEIDAVFRKRSSATDSGEVTRASAVNQILAKLDGVNALGNILVIGTTNRRELLDEALLRPGRLEVQLKVPLPDREGRREILQIHFAALRKRGRLSKPLCEAIDGKRGYISQTDAISSKGTSVRTNKLARMFSSVLIRRGGSGSNDDRSSSMIGDLAADRWTKGYSGADLEGLVRCAGSIALGRARQDGSGVEGLLITVQDVLLALKEVKG